MPKEKPARTARAPQQGRRGLRLGLAGRVALIGCAAAIVATLAQWVAAPAMAVNEVRFQRAQAVASMTTTLASVSAIHFSAGHEAELQAVTDVVAASLPGGLAILYGLDGRIVSRSGEGSLSAETLARLKDQPGRVLHGPDRVFAMQPVIADGKPVGMAATSFAPRTVAQIWSGVVWRCAVVLILALAVIAPFLLPLARRALSPVAELEARIRARAPNDRSRLSDGVEDGVLKPLIAAIDDVHARSEAATRRAMALAFADPVTQLPNRLRFMSKLEAVVDKAGQAAHFAVYDLNGFRKINMTLGPRAADEVLVEIAQRLRACVQATAPGGMFLGRIGADLFGVISPGETDDRLKAFLSAVETAMAEPITVDGQTIVISGATGVAHAPRDATTAGDLVKLAEIALKEAKHQSLAGCVFFDNRLMEKQRRQAKLESELREGLERGEFVAVFQPKIKLATGELVGAEALARWRRPDGSVVSPAVFVPLAEETGLISKLGHSVMRDACFAAAEWNRRGAAQRVAVNVSPHQFNDPDFVEQVWRALDDSGLDPSLLELEITESAAVSEPERVARIMWPLRNRGVKLAIDDFGTGHSNFTSITRLPFDVLKIDQQFVRALATDPNAPTIVEMILAMAEALGQETVAEGVETAEQADFLLRRNCSTGQGYHFSPPLPAHEFDAFVRSWRPRPLAKAA